MMCCRGRIAISAKLLVKRDLLLLEHCAGFEMRGQMNRTQSSLKISYRRGLGPETILGDLALGEELVERLFMLDQIGPERLRSRAHPVENHLDLLPLRFGELKFLA